MKKRMFKYKIAEKKSTDPPRTLWDLLMQRLSIQCLNVALLVIIFIGLPAVTQAQLGPLAHFPEPSNPSG